MAKTKQRSSLREDSAHYGANGSSPESNLRFIDLFCGIGGFRLAFERAGAKCVFSSDWDRFSRQTYAAIAAETAELYRESAEWQQIVTNLSATRIDREVRIKDIAASFQPLQLKDAEMEDVVMADFKPYHHVKIYELEEAPDLSSVPALPTGMTLLRHEVSDGKK